MRYSDGDIVFDIDVFAHIYDDCKLLVTVHCKRSFKGTFVDITRFFNYIDGRPMKIKHSYLDTSEWLSIDCIEFDEDDNIDIILNVANNPRDEGTCGKFLVKLLSKKYEMDGEKASVLNFSVGITGHELTTDDLSKITNYLVVNRKIRTLTDTNNISPPMVRDILKLELPGKKGEPELPSETEFGY